jgi:hypothetical protein
MGQSRKQVRARVRRAGPDLGVEECLSREGCSAVTGPSASLGSPRTPRLGVPPTVEGAHGTQPGRRRDRTGIPGLRAPEPRSRQLGAWKCRLVPPKPVTDGQPAVPS